MEALLDSGSKVSLVRPQYAGEPALDTVHVSCVHSDSRPYPTTLVEIQTPQGRTLLRAGVAENLPVLVLIGRDCSLFAKYWGRCAKAPQCKKTQKTKGIGGLGI